MRSLRILHLCVLGLAVFLADLATAQTTVTIGTGTSSSSTRGPFQRADTGSTTVFSRWHHIYTAAELATAGVTNGASITQLNWEIASSNVIIGAGDANVKIYVKNSMATTAVTDTWVNLTTGSSLVVDEDFNTTNNFPGANGWMPFVFTAPFTYTGNALEISVDWDCSQVSTPAFDGNGAIKFRWTSTAPDDLVVKKTSSSSPSTTIDDLKDERANIQIVFDAQACDLPTSLYANNISMTTADLGWSTSTNANDYDWIVVPAGAGPAATAIDAGTTTALTATATGLSALTSYDLYVEADCGTLIGTSGFAGPFTFLTLPTAQSNATVGLGTSSSSTRGPFQRSDTASSTVFSRFHHIYTASELAAVGITNGMDLTALNWELASSNVMIGMGDAALKVYIKNSSVTTAVADDWVNLIAGSSLVVDHTYNTANNFPGANGWMPFQFSAPFTYTGGALEVSVDWDCSQVSTPAFSGDGSLKWRWTSTAPDDLVVKRTSSSAPSTNLSDLKDERANIQFTFVVTSCAAPTGLSAGNITTTSADFAWDPSLASMGYNWKVVPAGAGSGATSVDDGVVVDTSATSTLLMAGTAYDLFVESNCGSIGTSGYSGPFSFTTLCGTMPTTTITKDITDATCNGADDGAIDVTVTAGIPPYAFMWSNAEMTEDISALAPGEYKLTITDGNGCPSFDSATVDEPDVLVLTGTGTPDTNGTSVGTGSVMVTGGTPPYTYTWNGVAGSSDTLGLTAGTYDVEVSDANGCLESTSIIVDDFVGLAEFNYLSQFSMAPNPTNGLANLDLELTKSADVVMSIYTIQGQQVETFTRKNVQRLRQPIDLSYFGEGVYFVRVSINEQVITKRLILIQ